MRVRAFPLLAAVLFFWASASAQNNPNTDQGLKPYDSFHGGNLDSVSMTSGNLFFHKTEYAAAQRGQAALTYSLLYNNKAFRLQITCVNGSKGPWQMPPGSAPDPSSGGTGCVASYKWLWCGNGVMLVSDQDGDQTSSCPVEMCPRVDTGTMNQSLGMEIFIQLCTAYNPDGSAHQLADTGNGYRAIDGSGILWQGNPTSGPFNGLLARDGLVGAGSIDTNGNFLSVDSSNNHKDTLGRVVPQELGSLSSQPVPASTASLSSCPNLNLPYQPLVAAYAWNPPGPAPSGTSSYILCYASVYIRTALFGTGAYVNTTNAHDVSQSVVMLQSLVRPDGTAWMFTYDGANPNDTTSIGYGDLLKMVYPTGGSVTYTYGTEFPYQGQYTPGMPTTSSRSVETRTVDANDGTGPHQWKYSWGHVVVNTLTNYVVENTVTDPAGNDTVHQITGFYGGPSLFETQTRSYQGSQSSGSLLKSVTTDYSYDKNPLDIGPNTPPPTAINVVPIHITTTWGNGQTSRVEMDYDSGFTFRDPMWGQPAPYGSTTLYPGRLGSVTARREYDYGQGQAGPLLRQTFTTYQWQVDSRYLAANLLELPAVVQVLDGAGHLCAETDYFYDEPGYLSTPNPAITTQHTTPSAVRGNVTTVKHKLSSTPCVTSATWTDVISHNSWFDTGELQSSSDPLGHTTTHLYDAVYAGAYSTQTCSPLTNGGSVSHCVSGTYDLNTGLPASFSNENATTPASGNTPGDASHTSLFSYDNMWRLTQVLSPPDPANSNAQDYTRFDYPPETANRHKSVTNGSEDTFTANFDGLGRTHQTQHPTPSGVIYVDTTYDSMGQVKTVSNPYFSKTDPTYGITQNHYDPLGRVAQIAPQDGTPLADGTAVINCQSNNTCTDFSNYPTVTTEDQVGNLRRSRTDALGRLVEVDEPGPGTNSPGAPGSGSISVSGALTGSKATGSVTVIGALQSFFVSVCNDTCIRVKKTDPGGTVTVTVNGHSDQVTYGASATSIANSLISTINGDGAAFVTASGPSCADTTHCTVSLQARTIGVNYSLSVQAQSNDEADGFSSFDATSASGPTLTDGSFDSGTLTVSVDGFQASAPYNQTTNNNPVDMASALATALNAPASPVTALPSGTTITLSAKTNSTGSDYTVAGSSTASFAVSSTTLANGADPGGLYAPLVTLYSYDALGNLLCVEQHGGVTGTGCSSPPTSDATSPWRVRRFTYDSLSRLLTAHNPESGTITYSYDLDGNLLQKTSPAPNQTGSATQTVSYCYDELHRVKGKGYGAQSCPLTSPVVTYTYDSGANAKGKLTGITDQAGTGSYSYDVLGRMSSETRVIAGISKSMSYEYNLDGSLFKLHNPSGAVITYTLDSAGRTVSAVDTTNSINYATSATYQADGQMTGFVSGNGAAFAGITNAFTYNKRLQPINMSASSPSQTVFSIGYEFHLGNGTTGSDNGNVWNIYNFRDRTRDQSFTYDALNRLTSAQNAGTNCAAGTVSGKTEYWGNSYGYDAWGNLTQKVITKCGAENLSLTALTNNQLSGYGYDAAGNMTSDPTDGVSASYDPENRIASATKAGVTTNYLYDADGNRVKKLSGSAGTLYWYMTPGIVAESDLAGNLKSEYVFFNGDRVARKDFSGSTTSVFYYFSDHLKTASVITDSSGNIKSESDYYPWGGELQFVNNDSNHYKFTGKERDTEFGLDYFGARYYSNGLGKLLQADEPLADQDTADPQSWNIYAYVRNNPLRYSDPSGRNCVGSFEDGFHDDGKNGGESCEDINDKDGEQGERTHADVTVQASYTQEERIQLLSDDVSDYTSVSSLSEYGREGVKGAMAAEGLWNLPGDTLTLYRGFRMGVRMAGVRAAGELGESLVQDITGLAKNTEQIPSTTGAAYRVPDVLSHAKGIVGEVKNTRSKIYLTGQIKDEIAFAQSRGYTFNLYVRFGAQFSQPLQSAINTGLVHLVPF